MKPKISVLMSVHNGEVYLEEAIKSILDQTYADFEFILINDASTDSTKDIIRSFEDQRIILIDNETNLGLTPSLNKGLLEARGEYIARMDADDVSHLDRLEKQFAFMELNKDVWVVGSNINIINDKGDVTQSNVYPETYDQILGTIFFKNSIVHSSAFFRREKIIEIGGYNKEYRKSQDYELWLQVIVNGGKLHNLQEILVDYRVHAESITQSSETSSEQEINSLKALQRSFKQIMDINVDLDTLKIFRYIYFHKNSRIPMSSYVKLGKFLKSLRKNILAKHSTETIQAFETNYQIFLYNLNRGVGNRLFQLFLNEQR